MRPADAQEPAGSSTCAHKPRSGLRVSQTSPPWAGPEARRRPDGKWEVTVPGEARKFYADAEEAEKEAPFVDRIEIGLFTAQPGSGAFDRRHIILMPRQPIRSGRQV